MCRDVLNNVLMSPSLFTMSLSGCKLSNGFPCYEQGMCKNLVNLTLSDCKVGGDGMNVNVMKMISNYPTLQYLNICKVEFANTETFICPSNSFPQFDRLFFLDLPDLKGWEIEEGAMPKLNYLVIRDCPKLEKVPRLISALKELHIHNMPEEFKERIRGQDSVIVSHIPTIHISDY